MKIAEREEEERGERGGRRRGERKRERRRADLADAGKRKCESAIKAKTKGRRPRAGEARPAREQPRILQLRAGTADKARDVRSSRQAAPARTCRPLRTRITRRFFPRRALMETLMREKRRGTPRVLRACAACQAPRKSPVRRGRAHLY